MKFVVDESIEYGVVNFLRQLGFDVISIAETAASIDDDEVLKTAATQKRVLLTNDKDFGELIYHQKLANSGVILLRLPREDTGSKIKYISRMLRGHKSKLENAFTVVTRSQVRIRRLKIEDN